VLSLGESRPPGPDDGPANTTTGWTGGFTTVLGNPPWETLQMSEKEFFVAREPVIAAAATAALRKTMIATLASSNPALSAAFALESHRGEAETHLIRDSRRFPLCAAGKINTYSVFAEHFRAVVSSSGRTGILTPTGLATDATTAPFFADTLHAQRLAAFYDFENEAKIFAGVHNQFRFAVTSMTGGERVADVRLAFYTRYIADVSTRRFALSADEILMVNPNTGTLPVFRSRRDAEITLACYRRHPVLIRDGAADGNPWGLRFSQGLFNMASDSGEFRTARNLQAIGATFDGWAWRRGEQRWLPLYEAKMLSHWNDRYATYEGATQAQLNKGTLPRLVNRRLDDPSAEPTARYWVAERAVADAVPAGWDREWFLGWRDITNASNERTFVSSVLPRAAVGHVFPIVLTAQPSRLPLLQAVWSSLVMDYVVRQKLSGTHMTYGVVGQLTCPRPEAIEVPGAWSCEALSDFVRVRVLELTFTSHRIRPYAEDVVGGDPGNPFRWLPERREQLRAELDAAMLHLYGLDRKDTEHVLDSFLVVRKYEERDHGEFRTKRLVLREYDAMTRAAETGVPYRSPLAPPPGHGPRHEEVQHD